MNSNQNLCMEASDLPLGVEWGWLAVGGTQEVQSEMEDAEERHKGKQPEAEVTTPLMTVLARSSNGQTLLGRRERPGQLMPETVPWGSVTQSGKMMGRFRWLSFPPPGPMSSRWWFDL